VSNFKFTFDWLSAGQEVRELKETTAQLALYVGELSLTQNEDVWSKTVRDSVLVSAYPLAMWLAASWWRLNFEPLPKQGVLPSLDWRMGHEMGAANHGYVWPRIVLASDGEVMQIWSVASDPASKQSVRYLNGLSVPLTVALDDFQSGVVRFVSGVLSRLNAMGQPETDLAGLWRLVQEDRIDTARTRIRRIEAQLGYDPEECPEEVMAEAIVLEERIGASALSELAPVYGRQDGDAALGEISRLAGVEGLRGKPDVLALSLASRGAAEAPWRRAVGAAKTLRHQLGNEQAPIEDATLYGLLGLKKAAVDSWTPLARHQVALAVPTDHGHLNFIPRKRHPTARRFEFSRFLGDYLSGNAAPDRWLASTDLATSRQKYQRAFAAEFLCPIDSLVGFLGRDFSESAIEEAATHFSVSEQTVESLLGNNGYITPRMSGGGLPYRLAA